MDLSRFVNQIRETLLLCNEKVQVQSPQGSYLVKRFVYRSVTPSPLSLPTDDKTTEVRSTSSLVRYSVPLGDQEGSDREVSKSSMMNGRVRSLLRRMGLRNMLRVS